MKKIETVEELAALKPNEKFYVLKNGNVMCFKFACISPFMAGKVTSVIAISDLKYTDAEVFCSSDFNVTRKTIFLSGKYDSAIIGEYMIKQMEKEIADIKEVYIDQRETE